MEMTMLEGRKTSPVSKTTKMATQTGADFPPFSFFSFSSAMLEIPRKTDDQAQDNDGKGEKARYQHGDMPPCVPAEILRVLHTLEKRLPLVRKQIKLVLRGSKAVCVFPDYGGIVQKLEYRRQITIVIE